MPIYTSDLTSRGIIYADTITTNSNEDLTLNPAGTGSVVANSTLKVDTIATNDSSAVSFNSPIHVNTISSSDSTAIQINDSVNVSGTLNARLQDGTIVGSATPDTTQVTDALYVDGSLRFGPIDGATRTAQTVTVVGEAHISTDQSKFGGGSLKFPSGSNLAIPNDINLVYWNNRNYTAECWVYLTAYPVNPIAGREGNLIGQMSTTNLIKYWSIGFDDEGVFTLYYYTGGSDKIQVWAQDSTPISLNEWHHVAFVHTNSSSNISLYIDGQRVANETDQGSSLSEDTVNYPLIIGRHDEVEFPGYVDEVRISNSVRYTGDSFTVPTSPFNTDGATKLLIHADGSDSSQSITDDATSGFYGRLIVNDSNQISLSITGQSTPSINLATDGSVGILTESPAYELDVAGDIRATGTVYTDTIASVASNENITLSPQGTGAVITTNIQLNRIAANDSSAVSITSALQTTTVQSSGAVTANSFVTGTLTVSDGQITDTDGTISFNNINLDAVNQATISTVITNVIESSDSTSVRINDGLQVDGSADVGGFFSILNTTQVNAILDEDNMASDSATALATQQSIKAYIDSNSGGTLPIGDSASNSGSVSITNSEELVFRSGDSITATVAGNGVTFDLNETITVDQINAGDSTAITVGSPLLVESTLFVNQINSLDSTSIGLQTDVQVTGSITVSDIITSRNSITGTDVIAQGSLFAGFITSNSNENITLSPGGTGLLNFYGAYTFPTDDGVNGQVLITDGAGTLSFGSTTAATQWTTVSNTDVDSAVEQIDAWSATTYQSAMYNYSIANSDATEYQTGTLHVVHDGTTAYFSEYGKVITGNNDLITFSVGLSGGSVLLYGSAQTPNSNFTSKRLLHLAPGAVSVGSGDNGVLTVRTDDTGRLDVTLAQQEFTVSGGNSISTSSDSSALTIGLDANITVNQIGARDSTSVSIQSPLQLDSTLQVAGNSALVGNVTVTGDLTVDTNTLYVDSVNNEVGIGTTTPNVKFEVATAAITNTRIEYGTTRAALQFAKSGTVQGALIAETISSNDMIYIGAGSSYASNPVLAVDATNQRVGIGTTSPTYKLDVAGDVRATGSIYTDTITTTGSNNDITISANGTGRVVISPELVTNIISSDDSTAIQIQDSINLGSNTITANTGNFTNFTLSDTLTIGSQQFIAQGTNGFSVNEDFDPSNSSTQTAYHFTSGAGRSELAFTLARTGQFTDGFGIYGTSADNTFVTFGEQNNTSFEWRRGVGIRPLDLDGGTLMMRLSSAGDLTINNDIIVQGSVIADTITTSGSNNDITISANGTGAVIVESLQIQGNVITATDSTQIAFGQQQLTDVADPTQASDVATKSYVDSQVSSNGITVADQWRLTTDKTSLSGIQDITANLSQITSNGAGTVGSAMTESSGIFSFPSTGIYLITGTAQFERTAGSANYMAFQMLTTTDNSSYNVVADGGETLRDDASSQGSVTISFMFNVSDTSTHKVKFRTDVSDAQTLKGNSTKNMTHFTFIRLGA